MIRHSTTPSAFRSGRHARVTISGHPIRDADLEALGDHLARFTDLGILDLRDCRQVTDRGIAAIPYLAKLKEVQLKGTSVTDRGIEALRRRYPGAEVSY